MLPVASFIRTGHDFSRLIVRAAAFGGMSQARADVTMEMIDRAGINHIDTVASSGASEDRLRPFLNGHRDRFLLGDEDRCAPAPQRVPGWSDPSNGWGLIMSVSCSCTSMSNRTNGKRRLPQTGRSVYSRPHATKV